MHYRKIGKTGIKVSNISFGASSSGGGFHPLKEEVGIEAVYTAVDNGSILSMYRLIMDI